MGLLFCVISPPQSWGVSKNESPSRDAGVVGRLSFSPTHCLGLRAAQDQPLSPSGHAFPIHRGFFDSNHRATFTAAGLHLGRIADIQPLSGRPRYAEQPIVLYGRESLSRVNGRCVIPAHVKTGSSQMRRCPTGFGACASRARCNRGRKKQNADDLIRHGGAPALTFDWRPMAAAREERHFRSLRREIHTRHLAPAHRSCRSGVRAKAGRVRDGGRDCREFFVICPEAPR